MTETKYLIEKLERMLMTKDKFNCNFFEFHFRFNLSKPLNKEINWKTFNTGPNKMYELLIAN